MTKQKKTHLLTGGNIGDRLTTLQQAKILISERIGTIVKASCFYETEAWGKVEQPDYINQALEVLTELSPSELLSKILEIENALGRKPRSKWESREVDIDILFYENRILQTPGLQIPHPLLHKRNFALVPLMEIAPFKKHPVFKKTIVELYQETEDHLDVVMLESDVESKS